MSDQSLADLLLLKRDIERRLEREVVNPRMTTDDFIALMRECDRIREEYRNAVLHIETASAEALTAPTEGSKP